MIMKNGIKQFFNLRNTGISGFHLNSALLKNLRISRPNIVTDPCQMNMGIRYWLLWSENRHPNLEFIWHPKGIRFSPISYNELNAAHKGNPY